MELECSVWLWAAQHLCSAFKKFKQLNYKAEDSYSIPIYKSAPGTKHSSLWAVRQLGITTTEPDSSQRGNSLQSPFFFLKKRSKVTHCPFITDYIPWDRLVDPRPSWACEHRVLTQWPAVSEDKSRWDRRGASKPTKTKKSPGVWRGRGGKEAVSSTRR